MSFKDDWIITSNRESGDGFSDIMIRVDNRDTGILIEVKYAEDGDEAHACRQALSQMSEKNYEAYFKQAGLMKIMKYAIACNKKTCKVLLEVNCKNQ